MENGSDEEEEEEMRVPPRNNNKKKKKKRFGGCGWWMGTWSIESSISVSFTLSHFAVCRAGRFFHFYVTLSTLSHLPSYVADIPVNGRLSHSGNPRRLRSNTIFAARKNLSASTDVCTFNPGAMAKKPRRPSNNQRS